MKRTSMAKMTQKEQEGADRFGELIEEYKRMKGVHGDNLQHGPHDLYTGILADGLHWAKLLGVNPMLAFSEAVRTAMQEAFD